MKNSLFLFLLLVNGSLFGQVAIDSFFTISGSVDTYFRANLNSTNDLTNGGTIAPGTSFANLPGFSLGMVNLITKYEKGSVSFVGDLVFGPRGKDAVFNSQGSLNIVNQAYVAYAPSDKLTLTLGKFNTFLGYEVISPTLNFNYSTSYMFSYGPFSHAGLKANYDLGSGFGAMVGIFNPTDYTDFNPTGTYLFGGQLSYASDAAGLYINTLLDGDFMQIDLTTTYAVSDKVNIGLNATTASDNFYGAAVYSNVALSDVFSAGVRAEYFKDNGIGILDGADITSNDVIDITLSGNYTVGNLKIIPEIRIDLFSDDLVLPDATDSMLANQLSSFVLAAVYSF